jgi:hypothetical protein
MSAPAQKAKSPAWRGPTTAWAVMMWGLVLMLLIALYGGGSVSFYGALGLSAVMLLTLAFGLVGISRESPLTRLVGGAAFLFIALMFFLSFVDLLTRIR